MRPNNIIHLIQITIVPRNSTLFTLFVALFCTRLIKDFEREARADGLPAADLANRKRELVQELNGYIAMKKELSAQSSTRAELLGSADRGKGQLSKAEIQEGAQSWSIATSGMNPAPRTHYI
jgi:hypothetical protein